MLEMRNFSGKSLDGKAEVLVAFVPWKGLEGNGLIVNESLVKDDILTSSEVVQFKEKAEEAEEFSRDLPDIGEDILTNLDERGIVNLGTEVKYGDILVGKLFPRQTFSLTPEERLLRIIFGAKAGEMIGQPLHMPLKDGGRIIDIEYFSEKNNDNCNKLPPKVKELVKVDVLVKRRLKVGDVLEDSSGNKGVVCQILPLEKMSRKQCDIIANPSSTFLSSSQLKDKHQGFVKIDGKKVKATIGCISLKKISNFLEQKVRAASIGPRRLINCQPTYEFGESVSYKEVEALYKWGAHHTLQELLTLKSDDLENAPKAFEGLIKGMELPKPGIPETFGVLVKELRGLGFDLNFIIPSAISFKLADTATILSWSKGEVKKSETINYRTFRPEPDGLFCEKIFGPVRDWECSCGRYKWATKQSGVICSRCGVKVTESKVRREWMGHVKLVSPVANVFYFGYLSRLLKLSISDLKRVIYYNSYIGIDPKDVSFLKLTGFEPEKNSAIGAKAIKILLLEMGFKQAASTMILDVLPIIPPDLRPFIPVEGGKFASSDLNHLYWKIINQNNKLKHIQELGAPKIMINNEKRLLQLKVNAVFDNTGEYGGYSGREIFINSRRLKGLSEFVSERFKQIWNKKVFYSGRGIIISDLKMPENQCGLSKEMAVELFKPLLVERLLRKQMIHTVKSAKRLIEERRQEIWETLSEVVLETPFVLLSYKRDPSSPKMLALKPVLIEEEVIKLSPLVCSNFGAKLDGDTVCVHLPLSKEAQAEGEKINKKEDKFIGIAKLFKEDSIKFLIKEAVLEKKYELSGLVKLMLGQKVS